MDSDAPSPPVISRRGKSGFNLFARPFLRNIGVARGTKAAGLSWRNLTQEERDE